MRYSLKGTYSFRELDSPPERLVHSLSRRAETYRSKGRYGEAEAFYLRALAIAEQAFGPDHLEVATVLNNLGVVYKYLACFAEASRFYQRSLAITKRVLGQDHPEVATLYHNL